MPDIAAKNRRNTESLLSVIAEKAQKVKAKDRPLSLTEIADGAKDTIMLLRDAKHMTVDEIVEFLRTEVNLVGSKERIRKEVSRVLNHNGSTS